MSGLSAEGAPTIGFAGLTHLGLCSAVAAASKGFQVIGYDCDSARVNEIAKGHWLVMEPGLAELAEGHLTRLAWRDDVGALGLCDVVYIASDVPTDDHGNSDLSDIVTLIDEVIPVLKQEAILVLLSQVPPGFTHGVAFSPERLYYQVETLVFGRAVERATSPERFIIGCADPARRLPLAFAEFLRGFGCPILPMRYESAELAKISINCCLVTSISVANILAELCEKIGADWSEIVPALKLDKRIGPHAYLAPGLGLAGGNLERDLATVLRLAETTGGDGGVIAACLRNSRHCRDWVLRTLHEHVLGSRHDAAIGVLGLAYKENTDSTKNSPSLALLTHLTPWRVQVYDPVVSTAAVRQPNAVVAKSALEAARGTDALVIMTPWPEFRKLNPVEFADVLRGHTVVDPYRVLDSSAVVTAGLDYFALGVPPVHRTGQNGKSKGAGRHA